MLPSWCLVPSCIGVAKGEIGIEENGKKMKVLLFQIRNVGDPMLIQEFECFQAKLESLKTDLDVHFESINIIENPDGIEEKWKDYDLIFVGGSGDYGCVENEQEWFSTFCGILRNIVDAEKPMFCSCFGHQALAVALGGEVVTDRSRSELGTWPVTLNEAGQEDVLLGKLPSPFPAQFGHNDQVVRLPRGGINLASTSKCSIQAYKLKGKLIYATQFHPELSHLENRERASNYLEIYAPELTTPEMLESLYRPSIGASELLPRFVRLVAQGHKVGGS